MEDDDFYNYFSIQLTTGFLNDVIEHLQLGWYYEFNECMVPVALRQSKWDKVVFELFKLSDYNEQDLTIKNLVYDHLGSIIAHYSTPKAVCLGDTFNTVLGLDFVETFFHLESGDCSYYRNGSYIFQIEPKTWPC